MTDNEIDILLTEQARADIETMIGADPVAVALDKRIEHSGLIATQVKYLQRARTKLPSYYDARAIMPALSFEQSSSEECARHKRHNGHLCIDLTCGLGVDSLYLSHRFEQVISVERDPVLARVARINFDRLGIENVEVVCGSAEDFVGSFSGHADLVYADPDRRGDNNRKLMLLEDCSPNVIALMPRLREISDKIVIKNSPMFDTDEALRIFGDGTLVEVVSLRGECKELIVEIGGDTEINVDNKGCCTTNKVSRKRDSKVSFCAIAEVGGDAETKVDFKASCMTNKVNRKRDSKASISTIEAGGGTQSKVMVSALGLGEAVFSAERLPSPISALPPTEHSYRYLLVPDVGLVKARKSMEYFSRFNGVWIGSDNGYAFSDTIPEGVLARAYEIESTHPYSPKRLKSVLKTRGVKNIDILKRDFPWQTSQIARELGIREGGHETMVFTSVDGERLAFFVAPIPQKG